MPTSTFRWKHQHGANEGGAVDVAGGDGALQGADVAQRPTKKEKKRKKGQRSKAKRV